MIKSMYLAGGCFWGVEEYFRRIKGITATRVGYANGLTDKTSYHELYITDHAETAKISFDTDIVSLDEILKHFFSIIEPLSVNRQGNDSGRQYRTGIYYTNEKDGAAAKAALAALSAQLKKEPAIECRPLSNFIEAEEYHQHYLLKNPKGYCHIKLK